MAIGPEEGGACENDKGRERSDSTERGSSSRTARGVGTGAKSSTGRERSSNTFHGTVPRYAGSTEAGALYGASPVASPGARTHGTCLQPPIGQRYCLITSPCEPRNRRRVMRRLVQAPGMARSGSSRR